MQNNTGVYEQVVENIRKNGISFTFVSAALEVGGKLLPESFSELDDGFIYSTGNHFKGLPEIIVYFGSYDDSISLTKEQLTKLGVDANRLIKLLVKDTKELSKLKIALTTQGREFAVKVMNVGDPDYTLFKADFKVTNAFYEDHYKLDTVNYPYILLIPLDNKSYW